MIYSEPKEIGKVLIKNRFIRSATYSRMAKEDGDISNELLEMYKTLAKGGVGLIITGYAYVQKSGIPFPGQLGADRDSLIPSLKKIAKTIHSNGDGCKVFLQLAHCGRQSYLVDEIVAPSAVLEPITNRMPREMTIEEIEETVDAFAEASRRAMEAGFDGVQLHSAHGYLLSGFLSPHTNRRTDKYGGNMNNRVRIFEEIYKKTTKLVGSDFPISIKMNADDFLEGGLKLDESKKIAEIFSKIGYASIEVSGGMWEVLMRNKKDLGWQPAMIPESRLNINTREKEAYHRTYAKEIKKDIDILLILVGGINSIELVEEILNKGDADFLSFSRPLIREPDLPNRWMKGIGSSTVECDYCNSCLMTLAKTGLLCPKKEES